MNKTGKLPKGRMRRSETVAKIVSALVEHDELSFKELKEKTGFSTKTISDTLKEMEYLNRFVPVPYLNREVTDDHPPRVLYSLLIPPSNECLKKLEMEFARSYENADGLGAIDNEEYLEQLLRRLERYYLQSFISILEGGDIDLCIKQLQEWSASLLRSAVKSHRKNLDDIVRIIYLKSLKRSIKRLGILAERYRPREAWERCDRCKFGKIDQKSDLVKCTRFWRKAGERKYHPRDYWCPYFEPMPR